MEEIIVDVKSIQTSNSMKGLADVTLILESGELTISKIRVMQGSSGLWVAFPQESYKKDGETKYVPIVLPSKRLERVIEGRVLDAYRKLEVTPV
jgi:DNA-binding cell septation regulator SpoVG